VSEIALPAPERRRELAKLLSPLLEGFETDAAEFRRLVRSFARRPQMLFLRELLRTGPARRSPENEVAWKGLRSVLLPVLEKGEVHEAELPWFIGWLSRLTVTRMARIERPAFAFPDRDARPSGPGAPGAPGGARGFGGPPGRDRFDRSQYAPRDRGGPGGPGGPGGRGGPPGGGRGGRPGDRDRDRGGPVRIPQGPREVDTRWDALKSFKLDQEEKKDKK
jgi:hypothetical protein